MRTFNFGPSATIMPDEVLLDVQKAIHRYGGSGLSLLEISENSAAAQAICDETEAVLRRVLSIPDDYGVLFLSGDLRLQYAQLPLNLMRNSRADYILTSHAACMAKEQADRYGNARVAVSNQDTGYTQLPDAPRSMFDPSADYTHLMLENPIQGTSFVDRLPNVGDVPLAAEASSCLFFDRIDVRRFGVLYTDTQSTLGVPGMTLIILRKEMIRKEPPMSMPTMLSYKRLLEYGAGMRALPPLGLFICKRMLEQIEREGGVADIGRRNREKAARLYDLLDNSTFYSTVAAPDSRSCCHIVFRTRSAALTDTLVRNAAQLGFLGLQNPEEENSVRISVCNGLGEDGVAALLDFLTRFQREHR